MPSGTRMLSRRFIITLVTILIVAIGGLIAAYIAKGYRVSPKTGTVFGTGIISVTSVPDQASVYLDDHLITATNANINSLSPKNYKVKIHKDGYIDWEKEVEVKQGLVTEIKATLFPALPSIYPLTQNGALQPTISPDSQKVAFIVPVSGKKGGVWVWTMGTGQIGFARGGEPHQIMTQLADVDLSQATLSWSPDSRQVLVTLPNRHYLLEQDRLNDPPRDITPILQPTLTGWETDQKQLDTTKIAAINDLQIRQAASSAASLRWSPDETKFIYADAKSNYKVADLKLGKTYDLPAAANYIWLADSTHIVIVDSTQAVSPSPRASSSAQLKTPTTFPVSKISVIEYEGTNKSEIFSGNFDPASVFAWPDASRVVMLFSIPTTTASQPNLYGVNLK